MKEGEIVLGIGFALFVGYKIWQKMKEKEDRETAKRILKYGVLTKEAEDRVKERLSVQEEYRARAASIAPRYIANGGKIQITGGRPYEPQNATGYQSLTGWVIDQDALVKLAELNNPDWQYFSQIQLPTDFDGVKDELPSFLISFEVAVNTGNVEPTCTVEFSGESKRYTAHCWSYKDKDENITNIKMCNMEGYSEQCQAVNDLIVDRLSKGEDVKVTFMQDTPDGMGRFSLYIFDNEDFASEKQKWVFLK